MTLLDVAHLSLAAGGKPLTQDLSARFDSGENWAVLGANGAGKTTLLHTLAGLRPPLAGQVRLDGVSIERIAARARARRIGLLLQDYDNRFPLTVLDTVLCGRHPHLDRWQWEGADDRARAMAALQAVGLAAHLERSTATLSGGERRRVEIAMLLTQDVPINLFDEPTNHLDLRHQIAVLELLCVRARTTAGVNLLVLHDLNLVARFCSHALLLFDDGTWAHGEREAILTAANLARLYRCRIEVIETAQQTIYLPARPATPI